MFFQAKLCNCLVIAAAIYELHGGFLFNRLFSLLFYTKDVFSGVFGVLRAKSRCVLILITHTDVFVRI